MSDTERTYNVRLFKRDCDRAIDIKAESEEDARNKAINFWLSEHLKVSPLVCPKCDKWFKSKSGLSGHERRCGNVKYAVANDLWLHLRKELKPYDVCKHKDNLYVSGSGREVQIWFSNSLFSVSSWASRKKLEFNIADPSYKEKIVEAIENCLRM